MTRLLRDVDRIFGRGGENSNKKVLVLILTSKLDASLERTVKDIPNE